MWADMAKVIGGDMIDVSSIVPVGSDPHLYEPTPSDIGKIKSADLIFINGLTFESWLTKLINNISEEKNEAGFEIKANGPPFAERVI